MICEFVMFLFSTFLAKPGAEPRRSGEVIRKYAGGSLKVFRRLNAGMFDCLTISVDRDQIRQDQQSWRWECGGGFTQHM